MNKPTNIDLNLIKLFASLYETGSVKTTAERLNISQSACSHALQRLREHMGDELFVRVGNGMLPTEYSVSIAKYLITGLEIIGQGLTSSLTFDPNEVHTYRIAVTDYTEWCIQPQIMYLSNNYPSIYLEFVRLDERFPEGKLREGILDFVCGFTHKQEPSENLAYTAWFDDSYVCIRCIHHPIQGVVELKQFLQYKHILVTPWNETRGIVDVALSKMKKKRKIAVKLSSVLAAPNLIQNTPHLLTLPKLYAVQIEKQLPIVISPLPFEVPNYHIQFYWHWTRNNAPKIQWLLQIIKKLNN